MGDNLVDDIEFILKHNYDTKMSSTKSHTQPKNDEEYIKNNEEFNNLDKTKGDNKIFHIPGTFSNAKDVDEKYKEGIKEFYNDKDLEIVDHDNNQELENNDKHRQKLANKLVDKIIELKNKNPQEPIRLTGHSHGGNVIKIATQKLVDKGYKNIVDDIMYLGTPVRDDYKTNNEVLKKKSKVLNVYDKSDLVQKWGGDQITSFFNINLFEMGPTKQIVSDNKKVKNIEV